MEKQIDSMLADRALPRGRGFQAWRPRGDVRGPGNLIERPLILPRRRRSKLPRGEFNSRRGGCARGVETRELAQQEARDRRVEKGDLIVLALRSLDLRGRQSPFADGECRRPSTFIDTSSSLSFPPPLKSAVSRLAARLLMVI